MSRRRVFWFAPINVAAFEKRVPRKLLIGAASRKVMNILAALRATGVSALAVAMPVVGRGAKFDGHGAELVRDKAPVLRLRVTRHPWLNRLLAAAGYLWVSAMRVRRADAVVLYNFYPEYIPACIFLRVFKKPAFLEIEDFPVLALNAREIIGFLSFKIVSALCHNNVIAVSRDVAKKTRSKEACIIQGVVSNDDVVGVEGLSSFSPALRVLFGGTLVRDTGSELFSEAVVWLREHAPKANIKFLVTGFGDLEQIFSLQEGNSVSAVTVEVNSDLRPDEYRAALNSCHASLCLKNSDSDFGSTTFPSKVIEIAGNGLLLISTKVSDVPEIFEGAAVLIDDFSGPSLGKALLWVLENESEVNRLAALGYLRVKERFSYKAVSSKLQKFILESGSRV